MDNYKKLEKKQNELIAKIPKKYHSIVLEIINLEYNLTLLERN